MINSRKKGVTYEQAIAKRFRKEGFDKCRTSREQSKARDDELVDLMHTEPFNVQCKALEKSPAYHDLLRDMPNERNYNVVFHKRNNKGSVVTMTEEDFFEIVRMLKGEEII